MEPDRRGPVRGRPSAPPPINTATGPSTTMSAPFFAQTSPPPISQPVPQNTFIQSQPHVGAPLPPGPGHLQHATTMPANGPPPHLQPQTPLISPPPAYPTPMPHHASMTSNQYHPAAAPSPVTSPPSAYPTPRHGSAAANKYVPAHAQSPSSSRPASQAGPPPPQPTPANSYASPQAIPPYSPIFPQHPPLTGQYPPQPQQPRSRPPLERYRSRSHDRGFREQQQALRYQQQQSQQSPQYPYFPRNSNLYHVRTAEDSPNRPSSERGRAESLDRRPRSKKQDESKGKNGEELTDENSKLVTYSDPYRPGRTFTKRVPLSGSPERKPSSKQWYRDQQEKRNQSQSKDRSQQSRAPPRTSSADRRKGDTRPNFPKTDDENRDGSPKPLKKSFTESMSRRMKVLAGAEAADDGVELGLESIGKLGEVL